MEMSGRSEFGGNSFAENQKKQEVDTDFILSTNNLIEQTIELIPALNVDREPDIAKYEFNFHAENVQELHLPELLANSLLTRTISDITVTTETSVYDPLSPTLSLRVYTQEGIGPDPDQELPPTARFHIDARTSGSVTGEFYNEELDTVTGITVPHTEFRKTIASLIFPSKDGDYQHFSDMNLLSSDVHPALTNALRKHADGSTAEARYYFRDDSDIGGWLSYALEGTKLRSAELYDIRKRVQAVSRTQGIIDEEVGLQVEMVFEDNSLEVGFYECRGPIAAENTPVPFVFEVKDIDDMREYVSAQLSLLASHVSIETVPFEEHHGSHPDDYPE